MRRLIPAPLRAALRRRLRPDTRPVLERGPRVPARAAAGFPAAPEPDLDRLAADLARDPAPLGWVLHFTPRAGASWLADIASGTGLLGRPVQSFEPRMMRRAAAAMNARTLDEYCALLPRLRARGGVWGMAASHPQIRAAFPSEADFLDRFGALPAIWLVRRDAVAQAVSLAKMRATGIANAAQADAARLEAADRAHAYDADAIAAALDEIRAAEAATEAMFEAGGIAPLRMSHEENAAHPPAHLLKVVGNHVGLGAMRVRARSVESRHARIATALNAEHAARFRAERADHVARVEEARAPMLDRIAPYGPRRAPSVL